MQSGFNTNIRHRGVLFHVQTEDGGAARPRVTTHLFLGGDILATERLDYADRLDAPDLGSEVRGRMQAQHKAMLRALCSGAHDAVVVARAGAAIFASDSASTLASFSFSSIIVLSIFAFLLANASIIDCRS